MVMNKKFLIVITIPLLFSACFMITGPEPPDPYSEVVIKNNSGVSLKYITYGFPYEGVLFHNDTIILNSQESYSRMYYGDGGDARPPMESPLLYDSVKIFFNNERSVIYRQKPEDSEIDRSPYSYEAYDTKMLGDDHYEYTYTITEEDYNNATPITE